MLHQIAGSGRIVGNSEVIRQPSLFFPLEKFSEWGTVVTSSLRSRPFPGLLGLNYWEPPLSASSERNVYALASTILKFLAKSKEASSDF